MARLQELTERPTRLTGGHRLCPGCGEPIVARQVLMSTKDPVIAVSCTGCFEVSTTIFPYTAWAIPWLHIAFENAAATIAGVEAMYKALKARAEKGQPLPDYIDPDADYKFVAFAGDGGTYDIGIQALSGAAERGHDFLYVCLNNEAYMNTGIQRSSATPMGANTTTSPAGSVLPGKSKHRKDLTAIMAAHDIPYVAQSIAGRWRDLTAKAARGFEVDGPAFINVLTPCPLGWRCEPALTPEISQLAVDTCMWPLYEVDHGEWKLNYTPKEKKPIEEYLEMQGRFRHLFRDEKGEEVRAQMQEFVDYKWEQLRERCGEE